MMIFIFSLVKYYLLFFAYAITGMKDVKLKPLKFSIENGILHNTYKIGDN